MKYTNMFKKWYFWLAIIILTIIDTPSFYPKILLAYLIGDFLFITLIGSIIYEIIKVVKKRKKKDI